MYKIKKKRTNLYQTNFRNVAIDSEKLDIPKEKRHLYEHCFEDRKLNMHKNKSTKNINEKRKKPIAFI